MIPVTKPSMPSRRRLDQYLTGIYRSQRLTNNGPLVRELTGRLEEFLGVRNLLLVSSGTMALQVAYRALEVAGLPGRESFAAVTTPFTFVATASSLKWEGLRPKYADIRPDTLNLCPRKAQTILDKDTRMLVPVHVYGNPCDVEEFAEIAVRSGLKLVYDAAHAFGIRLNGDSILNWGDASVLSFHATKVFHTVEGGGIVFRDADVCERAAEIINFGINPVTEKVDRVGINAKMSELHAAFGLALLDDIDMILERRMELSAIYTGGLPAGLETPIWNQAASKNAAYMPVLFNSSEDRTRCERALRDAKIGTRRYFSPCLGSDQDLPTLAVAKAASERVLCLPLYVGLSDKQVAKIVSTITDALQRQESH